MRPLIVAAVLAAACTGRDPIEQERFESEEEYFSAVVAEGWTPTREFGALVFASQDPALKQNTIAVRSIPLDKTPREIIEASRTVVAGLPQAKVRVDKLVDVGRLDGQVFEVVFTPPGKKQRYERRHLVLIGEERAFHVIHTAPSGRLKDSAKVFEQFVESLLEEG